MTLEEEPDMFQYYNNGITILADDVDFSDSTSIRIHKDENNKLSVINGAQTLTACADFFYDSSNSQEMVDGAKKSYVLLRIVSIKSQSENKNLNSIRNIENKISISLNRQKPITSEDLAMASEVITAINDTQIDESVNFTIVRNGEDEDEKNLHLYSVAKYLLATKLLKPGSARNCYRDTYLKMNGLKFAKDELWKSPNENNQEFINHYGLIRLAKKLNNSFEIDFSDLSPEEKAKVRNALDSSGEYLFISCVTYALFADKSEIITTVNMDTLKNVHDKLPMNIETYLQEYKKLILEVSKKDMKLDYAAIKSDDLFKSLIKDDCFKSFCSAIKSPTRN